MNNIFKNIIGHEKILTHLKSDIDNNNISHAYLFAGPSGVGKYTIGKELSKILQYNELNQSIHDTIQINELPIEGEENHTKDTNIDLKDRKTNTISVDDIGEIIKKITKSSFSRFKIVLIKRIERLNKNAINKLLKTLEEPPSENTIFILTTDHLPMIKKTIISRCRIVQFSTVDRKIILRGLENKGYKTETLEKILDILPGEPGKVIGLLEDEASLELHRFMWENLRRLLSKQNNLVDRFNFVEDIYKSNKKIKAFIDTVYYFLYHDFNDKNKSKKQIEELQSKLDILTKATTLMRLNVNSRLILENIMLVI